MGMERAYHSDRRIRMPTSGTAMLHSLGFVHNGTTMGLTFDFRYALSLCVLGVGRCGTAEREHACSDNEHIFLAASFSRDCDNC